MKNHLKNLATPRYQLLSLALLASLVMPLPALAASVNLATSPLATNPTSTVRPNIMFILDDSGSMDWNYLPDWANDTDGITAAPYTSEAELHHNSGFNGVAYNPAVTYKSPVYFYADGSSNKNTDGSSNLTKLYPDMLSPWNAVKEDGYGVQSALTHNLAGGATHYVFVFGEYCTSEKMTNCMTLAAPSATHTVRARLRWCNSSALTTCQSINTSVYKWPRYPGARSAGKYATATLKVTTNGTATSVKVGGLEILSATATDTTTNKTATAIMNAINACTTALSGNCAIRGYSATVNASTVTIYSPYALGATTVLPTATGTMVKTITAFTGYVAPSLLAVPVPGSNIKTDIVSTNNSYPYPGSATKASSRTDCAGTTCTYAEEITNYANWWAYYHTRMQSMKTAVSRAFKDIDSKYRVGYSTISNVGAADGTSTSSTPTYFLQNDTFEKAHKNNWYVKLFKGNPSINTPLRGALSKAGRYYANKIAGQTDPVQYSCQQNFTILSTDGYWNAGYETANPGYGPYDLTGANVGNLDAAPTVRPLYEGPAANSVSNSLADVAKYYYETDLRTSTLANCAGGVSDDYPAGNPDVCTNNVFISTSDNNTKQHMTTFTMGLGADGLLQYTSDYETAITGDFYDLKNGLNGVNWPKPAADTATAIDDLWHAAINGRGAYFSAKSPDDIIAGFKKALSSITAKVGSAAAAATSTLNPVAGNNFAYVASYTTVKWTGNLEARTIDVNTGVVSESASWCIENVVASTCTAPSYVATVASGSSTITNCVTPSATLATCPAPGVFDGSANTCSVEIAKTCIGTMPGRVGAATDNRVIYTANGSALTNFDAAYATAHPAYFEAAHINGLSQWGTLTPAQQSLAEGANLVNFLRGRNGYEDRASNTDKLYRFREAVTGDALESQPAYTSSPVFSYPYPGYTEYATTSAATSRAGTVYMGTNDGMMHAYDASNGVERWAYVPSMVIPNMWKLADTAYGSKHVNFVNGSPMISDICINGCDNSATAVWKTILVAGLNAGGRGYYALDITDVGVGSGTPKLLWEFTTTDDANLGYSFGQPVVTRKNDGKWVVLVTSGYNNGTLSSVTPAVTNTPTGNGLGYLYVIDAYNGPASVTYPMVKISTGVGSAANPSGLARIAAWNLEPAGNLAGSVYGGDLQGNLWRFDINAGSVFKFATLKDPINDPQPITTTPVLGDVSGNRVVFIGTGKYLEIDDLVNKQKQTQYAIKDADETITLTDPRGALVPQVLTTNSNGTREVPPPPIGNAVDFSSGRGWYIDFPDTSTAGNTERTNVDSQLVQGVLIVPTIVPSNTVCSPGGYGWLNYFGYDTGYITGLSSLKYDSPIVGINVIYIKGKPIVSIVTSAQPTPNQPSVSPTFASSSGEFQKRRWLWRELTPP
jgi:type IV pilus assembly protein PilY1